MSKFSTTQSKRIMGLIGLVALLLGLSGPALAKENNSDHWDKNVPTDLRYTVLTKFNNEAVRDNKTGLVWERSPDTTPRTWEVARAHCSEREVDGRKGWSLPMREQLMTLVDNSNKNPALPTDHPFKNVQSAIYWSATTFVDAPTLAWIVDFGYGREFFNHKDAFSFYAWCVR